MRPPGRESAVTVWGRRAAGAVAGAGIVVAAVAGPAGAVSRAGGAPWAETSTGDMSVMSLAQPNSRVTWAAGAEITTDPQNGSTRFTPAMYQRDIARGGAWRRLPLPGADAWNSRINDVATAPDGSAFFVGDQPTQEPGSTGSGPSGVLVGRWTGGGWQLTSDTALPPGTVDSSLLSVSSVSGRDAWAVGQGYDSSTWEQVPVVQHWNGRAWKPVEIPGSAHWGLYQVDEVAPDDVWIVGSDYDTGQSLAVHWNGHAWKRTPTPQFPDSAVLFDVVARSPHDVWAVGWSRDTGKQRPAGLALHWDGHRWTRLPLPAGTFMLQSVALRPHGGIAVVGGGDDGPVGLDWTAAHGWTSLGLPAPSSTQLPLGISAVAANGPHLTVGAWHFTASDDGDTFVSGALLTR